MTSLMDRFMAKVGDQSGCWEWTAFIDRAGYARIGIGRSVHYAHRVAHELFVGPIPDGLDVDHKCRNRACVNPAHLHAVTRKQNLENLAGANSGNRSTGKRNVYQHKPSGRFYVRVGHGGRSVYGGYFGTVAEADHAATALRNQLFTNNLADIKETPA